MDQVITAPRLPDDWREAIEAEIEKSLGRDLRPERERLRERLRRYARIYAEGHIDEAEYQTVRAALERDIVALEPSSLPDVERAGQMLGDFPAIWEAAKPAERHQLLRATFTAVYCDPAEGVLWRPRGGTGSAKVNPTLGWTAIGEGCIAAIACAP